MADFAAHSSSSNADCAPAFLLSLDEQTTVVELPSCMSSAIRSGFSGVEMTLQPEKANGSSPVKGSTIESGSCPSVVLAQIPANLADGELLLQTAINIASRFTAGDSTICIRIPARPIGPNALQSDYGNSLNVAWRLFERTRWLAEQHGVAVCIEAGASGSFLSPVEMREFLDGLHSHSFGVCIDALQLSRFGRLSDWLATLGHRVCVVRLGDAPAQPKALPRARCSVNEVLTTLRASRFSGAVVLNGPDELMEWSQIT